MNVFRARRKLRKQILEKKIMERMEETEAKRNLWQRLNGWKTAAAAIYWPVVYQVLPIWYPDGLPADVNRVVVTVGIMLTALGVGHKWYKKNHAEVL